MTRLRDKMPDTARMVDAARECAGRELIDRAIATSERARKTYEAVLAAQGQHAAETWRDQHVDQCCFYAEENGHVIGLDKPEWLKRREAAYVVITPKLDERLVRAAEAKLEAERQRQKRREQHGAH